MNRLGKLKFRLYFYGKSREMNKLERVLLIATVSSIFLNVFLVFPGSNLLFVLSSAFLSLLYFALGFALFAGLRFREILKAEKYKKLSALRILGAVGTGFALSIAIIGILFKVMFWPGYFVNLSIGLISVTLIFIIALVRYSKTKSTYYKKITSRCFIFGILATILISIPSTSLAAFKFRNEPDFAKALVDVMNNPDDAEAQARYADESRKRSQE